MLPDKCHGKDKRLETRSFFQKYQRLDIGLVDRTLNLVEVALAQTNSVMTLGGPQ